MTHPHVRLFPHPHTHTFTSPGAELKARIGQAKFLTEALQEASCPEDEQLLIEASLRNQPMYFAQPCGIVYQNEHFVVVDKPFDIQISHGRKQQARFPAEVTLVERIVATEQYAASASGFAGDANPRRCHNLDYATSGMLALAKTPAALRALSSCFNPTEDHIGTVQKEYVAVVLGHPEWDAITVDGDIDADPGTGFKMRVVNGMRTHTPRPPTAATKPVAGASGANGGPAWAGVEAQPGKGMIDPSIAARWGPSRMPPAPHWDRDGRSAKPRHSVTDITVLRRGANTLLGPLHGRPVTLVKLVPHTGRRHQLRVHLAHLGFPIMGDVAYAGDISTHRLCLHALAITFKASDPAKDCSGGGRGGDPAPLPFKGTLTVASKSNPFDSFVSMHT